MAPVTRTFALLMATAVAFQALAGSESVLVCRYTGNVVEPCPCPKKQSVQESDCGTLKEQSCCELRTSDSPVVPALTERTVTTQSKVVLAWAPPPAPHQLASSAKTILVAARQQAPPSVPLYLSVRSLLI